MDEFEILETKAREKRDATIAQARKDYQTTLAQIAAVRTAIVGNRIYRASRARTGQANQLTLRQTLIAVLGNRQLTLTEITVGVLESGYKTLLSKRDLRRAVAKMLRKDGRFKRDGARWTADSVRM